MQPNSTPPTPKLTPPTVPSRSLKDILAPAKAFLWCLDGTLEMAAYHNGEIIPPNSVAPGHAAILSDPRVPKVPHIADGASVFLVRSKTTRMGMQFSQQYGWPINYLASLLFSYVDNWTRYTAHQADVNLRAADIAVKINALDGQSTPEAVIEREDLTNQLMAIRDSAMDFSTFTNRIFEPGAVVGEYTHTVDGIRRAFCPVTATADIVSFLLTGCGRVTAVDPVRYLADSSDPGAYTLVPYDREHLLDTYDFEEMLETYEAFTAMTQLLIDAGLLEPPATKEHTEDGEAKGEDSPPLPTSSGDEPPVSVKSERRRGRKADRT